MSPWFKVRMDNNNPGEAGFSWWDCRITAVTTGRLSTRPKSYQGRGLRCFVGDPRRFSWPELVQDTRGTHESSGAENLKPIFPPKKISSKSQNSEKKIYNRKISVGKIDFSNKKNVSSKSDFASILRKKIRKIFQNFSEFFSEKNLENFSTILLKIFWKFFEHFFQIFFWTFFKKNRTIFEISDEPICQFQKIWNNKRTNMFISEPWCTASCWIRSCRGFAGPAPRAHSSFSLNSGSNLGCRWCGWLLHFCHSLSHSGQLRYAPCKLPCLAGVFLRL